jgi:hypothetical protein
VQIYDALNEANRAKFISLPWQRMVKVGWKLAKPAATGCMGIDITDHITE